MIGKGSAGSNAGLVHGVDKFLKDLTSIFPNLCKQNFEELVKCLNTKDETLLTDSLTAISKIVTNDAEEKQLKMIAPRKQLFEDLAENGSPEQAGACIRLLFALNEADACERILEVIRSLYVWKLNLQSITDKLDLKSDKITTHLAALEVIAGMFPEIFEKKHSDIAKILVKSILLHRDDDSTNTDDSDEWVEFDELSRENQAKASPIQLHNNLNLVDHGISNHVCSVARPFASLSKRRRGLPTCLEADQKVARDRRTIEPSETRVFTSRCSFTDGSWLRLFDPHFI